MENYLEQCMEQLFTLLFEFLGPASDHEQNPGTHRLNSRLEELFELVAAGQEHRCLAQDQPDCPSCKADADDTIKLGYQDGVEKTRDFYEGIPGVTALREKYQLGQTPINIVNNDGTPINKDDLSQALALIVQDTYRDMRIMG